MLSQLAPLSLSSKLHFALEFKKAGVNHFALKSKIYLTALKSAYAELVKLEPQSLTA